MADRLAGFFRLRARYQGINASELQRGERRRLTGGGACTIAERRLDVSFARVNNGSTGEGGAIVRIQRDKLVGIFKGGVGPIKPIAIHMDEILQQRFRIGILLNSLLKFASSLLRVAAQQRYSA